MRIASVILVPVALAFGIVSPAAAQSAAPALTPAQLALACAPPAVSTQAAHALRIVGAQDTAARTIFDEHDLLIVNGGTAAGVQLGAVFFARRSPSYAAMPTYGMMSSGESTITDGWMEIVAVNDTTSIARADHVCGAIFADDFLEPFAAPPLPPEPADDHPPEADFKSLARVISGDGDRPLAAIGEVMLIDRGSADGVQPGARFAIYRDLTIDRSPILAAPKGTPLTPIGEAVVVSAGGKRSIARILRARDAIFSGDYAAPEK